MIKTFEDYSIDNLRYSIFDWDDNLLYMPTTVHLDIMIDDDWVPIDIFSYEFHDYIYNKNTRLRNKSYFETFKEQTDKGPRGNNSFLLDTIKAIKMKSFGPSWNDFIHSLVDGRIFLIITARGHEPASIRKSVEWIIYNYLTDDQLDEMTKNLSKYHELFGENPDDIIEHYLNNCEYVAIMSDYFKKTFDVPEMKISELVGYGKSLAIKRFLRKVKKASRLSGLPAKVGFSDDRKRTVNDVVEFLSGEKSIDDQIEYYVFDTSGNKKKKIKI